MESHIIKPKIEIVKVVSNQRKTNLPTRQVMRIGKFDEKNKYRVLFNIPINEIPPDSEILSAKLFINIIDVEGGYLNKLTPYQLIEEWSINTVNWSNQPGFSKENCGKSVIIRTKSQYIIEITSIIQNWYNNRNTNYGIVLKNKELYEGNLVMMSTNEDTSCGPKVEICYETKSPCKSEYPCEIISTKFISRIEEVCTKGTYNFSRLINTSLTKTVMYFVENLGVNEIVANLQVSPDGVNFIDEPTKISPTLNKLEFIVPCIFAKFTRVAVKNVNPHETSKVRIWYQAQE